MLRISPSTYGSGTILRTIRRGVLIISFVGMLAVSAGTFCTSAQAGQAEELRSSLSALLFKAVTANDLNAVRTVVEAGADLSNVNMNGQTAMDIAVDRSLFDIAQYLVFARRIEQQTALNTILPIATVQQSSPEAAPVIVTAKKEAPAKPAEVNAKQPTYGQLMSAAIRLAAAAEELANKSAPEPVVTKRQMTKPQLTKTEPKNVRSSPAPKPVEVAEAPPSVVHLPKNIAGQVSNAPVFVIGPNGQLTQATPEQIFRAKKARKTQLAAFLPDVEPRKSFFMPKPRNKPTPKRALANAELQRQSFTTELPKAKQVALPTSRIPKTTTPRIEVPAFAKPSIPRISDGTAPQWVRIRPTRRTSPQPRNKLRRRLRTIEKPKPKVFEINSEVSVINGPKAVDIAPLVPAKPRSDQNVSKEPPTEAGTVEKLISGLGRFFGFKNEPNPIQQIAQTKEPEQKIKPEIVIARAPDPQTRVQPQLPLKPLPQNTALGFETHKVTPAPIPVQPQLQTKKPVPSLLKSVKEVLLPATVTPPKVDASISKTAVTKAKGSSLRRLTRAMPLSRLRKPLKNVLLTLGDSVATGQTKLPRGIAEPDACVRKRRGIVSFCIIPVDWPRVIESAFAVNTNLYQGTRAIARYDTGKASHLHALYTSADHDKIIAFMKKRYGPPTDIWKRMIAPFGKPRQPNPTFVWRSHNTETDQVTILEVRKFDDSRSVFPDTAHGVIRLYPAGGPPVFPIITAHDIMSIDWAARSDHIDGASPALARTIRVQP